MDLEQKQRSFNAAMELYTARTGYKSFGKAVAAVNVSLQTYLVCGLTQVYPGLAWLVAALIAAYLVTDFLNGLVHMVMDNNDSYHSIAGPLIANFHLHHKRPMYRKNPLYLVYFNETGSKVWLAGYLLLVSVLLRTYQLHPVVVHFLVYVGVLSSVAEVSHYLCHTSTSTLAIFLARIGLLLPKRHHAWHHREDNRNYAFLNGFTDPLINLLAARFYPGYKNTTDLHYARYAPPGAEESPLQSRGAPGFLRRDT